jgi:hypothetical protein
LACLVTACFHCTGELLPCAFTTRKGRQDKTIPKTKKTRQGKARQDKARQGKAKDKTRQGKAMQKRREEKTRQDKDKARQNN